jgi:two-component system NtrC family sensor kinase
MVDLNTLVDETVALRFPERHAHVEVLTALATGLPRVLADAQQLQQVLLNLIVNAEQAMLAANGRGSMVLRTWYDAGGESVLLEVADDGPGVPADLIGKIFDPFFTTKGVAEGTGLGLTVASAIVREHGGQIRVDARTNGGASFVVELPAASAGVSTPQEHPQEPSMEAVRGSSILLVEDEHALATAIAEALTEVGLKVDHAGDGQQALAHVRQNSYDAVVCDLNVPRVDGMIFYRAIAAATPTLARRVIFVTGDVAGADVERFLEESGCRWLAKPFRLADLMRALRDTLA